MKFKKKDDVSLGDALYKALTGGKSPHTEGKTFGKWARDAVNNLGGAGRGGGVRKLAQEVGVSPSTVRRWMKSKARDLRHISPKNADALQKANRKSRMKPESVRRFVGSSGGAGGSGGGSGSMSLGGSGLTISANTRKSNDYRPRTIYLGPHLPSGSLQKVVDALVEGGPTAAENVIQKLVHDNYVEDLILDAITSIEF